MSELVPFVPEIRPESVFTGSGIAADASGAARNKMPITIKLIRCIK
jgi:hypothetical protein